MELKAGMIGLSGGNGFIQKCIRFFIESDFSHSFTIVDGPCSCISALETTDTRVCVTPMTRKQYEENWVEIWEIEASEVVKEAALRSTYAKYSGLMYGYFSYLWFMYRWLVRKLGADRGWMWDWASKGVTCTELTSSYVRQVYPDDFLGMDINAITVRELRLIMLAKPDRYKLLGWYKI